MFGTGENRYFSFGGGKYSPTHDWPCPNLFEISENDWQHLGNGTR